MAISASFQSNFNTLIDTYGVSYILVHKDITYDNYDQEIMTTGTIENGSCYFLPVSSSKNGEDWQYLQQGVVKETDYKVFVPSGPVISGADMFVINAGSYSVLRFFDYYIEGRLIYKKVFVRTWQE